jgi:hypothetical protein
MALTYDPTNKKWNLAQEKTDYQTNFPTNLENSGTVNLWVKTITVPRPVKGQIYYSTVVADTAAQSSSPGAGWISAGSVPRDNVSDESVRQAINSRFGGLDSLTYLSATQALRDKAASTATTYRNNEQTNNLNTQRNQENTTLNTENTNKNNAYNTVLATANSTQGGDYVTQREQIRKLQGISDVTKSQLEDYFKAFYSTEKLQTWNANLGAKPQYGDFDPKYYKSINPDVEQKWKAAVANDDIDITQRYSENSYYLQHYTSQGKAAGKRGNAAEQTTAANQYLERKPTDADIQAARSLQLGLNTDTQTERLLAVPEVSAEWDKAKAGDQYWKTLGKEKFLNPEKPDEFAALFRLSQRPEDKQVSFAYNLNAGYGVTELEDAVNQAVGEKATVDAKKFGALTQNVLKDTIEQMKKAKGKEQMLGLMQGFSGFGEIMDINKELSNSILGDSGVGGILSFTSGKASQDSLEKSLQNITGVNNSTTYNWQQWFDTELKKKYEQEVELGYSTEAAKDTIKVEAQFARDFMDKYLIPRFNTSRSISEFTEYLDVRQQEQNPFQTQDMLNAVSQVANLRADQFLAQVQNTPDRYFNADFYFNPTGDKARTDAYSQQSQVVADDWEKAKAGDEYWASQAYRFGIDPNNKEQFARMHFQVKGKGLGYDPAEDVLNAGKVQDEIYNKILPSLKEEALKQGSIFGQFITPEEFADEMLQGLDPTDKATWQKALDAVGLKDFQGNLGEFKDLVAETLRTGSAQQIREQIKYLNEKGKKPTQKILGVDYIERPEDYKTDSIKSETEMYRVFQQAGYKGTEDEFYTDLFPDTDRSEQQLLTKAGAGSALQLKGLDLSDPFASLGTIQSFFGDEDTDTTDETTTKEKSIFNLGLDDEETSYKSKTGSQILGEFTSMFKGF